ADPSSTRWHVCWRRPGARRDEPKMEIIVERNIVLRLLLRRIPMSTATRLLHAPVNSRTAPYAALVLRLALGVVFVAHALLKLLVFTLPGTAAFFSAHGFPGWSAYPVFVMELVGGTLLIFGLYTRWVALALVPVLLGALTVHWPNG